MKKNVKILKRSRDDVMLGALQAIARGHNCKRPLSAAQSMGLAKRILNSIGEDWVGLEAMEAADEAVLS